MVEILGVTKFTDVPLGNLGWPRVATEGVIADLNNLELYGPQRYGPVLDGYFENVKTILGPYCVPNPLPTPADWMAITLVVISPVSLNILSSEETADTLLPLLWLQTRFPNNFKVELLGSNAGVDKHRQQLIRICYQA